MTDTLPGKLYGTLHVWPDGDTWRYLPAAPRPQRNADGRAQLTVIDTAGMLMVTLGASLSADESELAAAVAMLKAQGDGQPVRLQPAAATPRGASLILVLDGKAPVDLARANPSPVPPYSAAFSAMLRDDVAKQANAAMKSGEGRIEMAYDLELQMSRAVTARITGDPGDAANAETALKAGMLTLTVEADPGASEALKEDARRRVVDDVTAHLARLKHTASTTPTSDPETPDGCADPSRTTIFETARAIDAHVTRTEPDTRAIRLTGNLADWL